MNDPIVDGIVKKIYGDTDTTTRTYGARVTFQTLHPLTTDQAMGFRSVGSRFRDMKTPAPLHLYTLDTSIITTDAVHAANEVERVIESILQFEFDITDLVIRDMTNGGIL